MPPNIDCKHQWSLLPQKNQEPIPAKIVSGMGLPAITFFRQATCGNCQSDLLITDSTDIRKLTDVLLNNTHPIITAQADQPQLFPLNSPLGVVVPKDKLSLLIRNAKEWPTSF